VRGLALVAHEFRYDQKQFWRNPAAVFFTVMFPVLLLVIFNLLFGDETIEGLGVSVSTYYVPAIITLAVITATAQTLAISLTRDRETGLLKRVRGTPLPPWVFIAGRVGNALVISTLMLVVLSVIGRIAYGVTIPTGNLGAVILTLAVGAASFCCIGFALTGAIPSQEAAPPIVNAALLPLYFISGIFVPEDEIPIGVLRFADAFPIRHFFEAFFSAWDPNSTGGGLETGQLAIVLGWGVAALAAALLTFRWEPRR
jgi:ABC-2 type transport system permease protein